MYRTKGLGVAYQDIVSALPPSLLSSRRSFFVSSSPRFFAVGVTPSLLYFPYLSPAAASRGLCTASRLTC